MWAHTLEWICETIPNKSIRRGYSERGYSNWISREGRGREGKEAKWSEWEVEGREVRVGKRKERDAGLEGSGMKGNKEQRKG